jgi:hypothetical protein
MVMDSIAFGIALSIAFPHMPRHHLYLFEIQRSCSAIPSPFRTDIGHPLAFSATCSARLREYFLVLSVPASRTQKTMTGWLETLRHFSVRLPRPIAQVVRHSSGKQQSVRRHASNINRRK